PGACPGATATGPSGADAGAIGVAGPTHRGPRDAAAGPAAASGIELVGVRRGLGGYAAAAWGGGRVRRIGVFGVELYGQAFGGAPRERTRGAAPGPDEQCPIERTDSV